MGSEKNLLIAIPAYNEEATIGDVAGRVRASLPHADLLVVNDASKDQTASILESLHVATATHICNLGYGRAIQTAIKYAARHAYRALIVMDADGQHHPEQLKSLIAKFDAGHWDMLIGSRFIKTHNYCGSPLGRQLGMRLFSALTRLATGRQVHDTTSGLKMISKTVFAPLTQWHFVDFHAEAIVYLLRLGYRVGEHPITVSERLHGQSMYNFLSHFEYPLKTSLMIMLGILEANLSKNTKKS